MSTLHYYRGIDGARTAIILTGGKSLRMGNDKALLNCPGGTLLERIIQHLDPLFDEIIISTADSGEPGQYEHLNRKIAVDTETGRGPLMGILCGLRLSRNNINFVIACDIPNIDDRYLRTLLDLAPHHDMVIPISGKDKYEPLFAIYNKQVIPVIQETLNKGINKVIEIFDKCNTKYIPMDHSGWYQNLNTPKDYKAFMEAENEEPACGTTMKIERT